MPEGAELRRYVIAPQHLRDALLLPDGDDVRLYDPLAPEDAEFCLAMNRANRLAYDGTVELSAEAGALGMPLWVMLDCCMLPTVIVGYELRRNQLPPELANMLDPRRQLAAIGVSEYIGIPTLVKGQVVGASLFSLLKGGNYGRRTKAYALRIMGVGDQIGVTQFTNPSIRLHLSIGEMEILTGRTLVHSRPAETFVYRVRVPSSEQLDRLSAGEVRTLYKGRESDFSFDPRSRAAVAEFERMSRRERLSIVGTGDIEDGELTALHVRRLGRPTE